MIGAIAYDVDMAQDLIIFYVADQEAAARFYRRVFDSEPLLHVPGMTTFQMPGGAQLGLMPEEGIKRLLGGSLPDPAGGNGIPRAEIYLALDDDPAPWHARSLEAGARELSPLAPRAWGDRVAYSLDPDGHVLAFAERIETSH